MSLLTQLESLKLKKKFLTREYNQGILTSTVDTNHELFNKIEKVKAEIADLIEKIEQQDLKAQLTLV